MRNISNLKLGVKSSTTIEGQDLREEFLDEFAPSIVMNTKCIS